MLWADNVKKCFQYSVLYYDTIMYQIKRETVQSWLLYVISMNYMFAEFNILFFFL